ncbi:hypothetical protein [Vallitalea guaymasensis]|uniref:Uncharacterized protein n=1 Tax=Vallitalea guaymasensis TaxID=1185412 RepID=A0A8J8M9N9_9FIRM|nr:hypothetical protein [Vallitalea guaymasensis]QUH28783.1 hypothetical protein HYG85_07605 [Vallitalea guaymasensis]
MDLILDILMKKEDFKKLNIVELFNEWGGKKIPHEPRKFEFNSKLVFHLNTDMDYYKNIIKQDIDVEGLVSITLEDNTLSELETMVNQRKELVLESDLVLFLSKLYDSLELFYIVKLVDEERIDKKYIINDTKKAIDVFLKSLDWSSPLGVMITKNTL